MHEGVAAAAARGLARAPALPAGGAAGYGAAGGVPDTPGPSPRKTSKDWFIQETDSIPIKCEFVSESKYANSTDRITPCAAELAA